MPRQIFAVVRAPEHAPFDAGVLEGLLKTHYQRTEVMVYECNDEAQIVAEPKGESIKLEPSDTMRWRCGHSTRLAATRVICPLCEIADLRAEVEGLRSAEQKLFKLIDALKRRGG